ncbi:MAG: bifunctional ADP-dependent NAD(P)H-hydrate dehydratase/NAD(P)H-hydrate epimerase [Aggregatilineales bacterium]
MPKLVTVDQMRALEAAADAAGVAYAEMMEHAGRAVAERVKELIADIPDPRVAVLVGKGNNGGDGLVAARLLKTETNALVSLFLLEPRPDSDAVFVAARDAGLFVVEGPTDAEQGYRVLKTMVANSDVIIDALLGTGAKLPIKGELQKVLRQVRQALRARHEEHSRPAFSTPASPGVTGGRDPVMVAIDLPSGLDADTGALDPNAIHADETITLEAVKPGLLTFPGAAAVGKLHVAPLGIPEKTAPLPSIKRNVVDAAAVRKLLPERAINAHKGTFGKALITAGSVNYVGAAALAAVSAYRVGAGLVTVAVPQPIALTLAGRLAEATWLLMPHDMGVLSKGAARVLREEMGGSSALLIGPGLGHEPPTGEFIEALFEPEAVKTKARPIGFAPAPSSPASSPETPSAEKPLPPLVIDADGLNLLAKIDQWWTRLPARTILTPHPGEMARLAGIEDEGDNKAIDRVQADRIGLAVEKAAVWNAIVVLKGAFTVIADPDGRVAVLPFANPGLAHAGTGDVLAGMVVGFLAQGLDPFDAAVAAGYTHGYAGELATGYVGHPASVMAGDVAEHIADALAAIQVAE